MSTFTMWMIGIIAIMVIVDAIALVGYNKKYGKKD